MFEVTSLLVYYVVHYIYPPTFSLCVIYEVPDKWQPPYYYFFSANIIITIKYVVFLLMSKIRVDAKFFKQGSYFGYFLHYVYCYIDYLSPAPHSYRYSTPVQLLVLAQHLYSLQR